MKPNAIPSRASTSTTAKPIQTNGCVMPGRLRLARGRLDVGGEDQTHTDAGADGGEAVTDGGGATHYFGEVHFFDSSWYLA